MGVIKERLGRAMYGGSRLYLEEPVLEKVGLKPGTRYETQCSDNQIHIIPSEKGLNRVSSKVKKDSVIPVIDKQGFDIKAVLSRSSNIVIKFVESENGNRVIIEAVIPSAEQTREMVSSRSEKKLTTLSLCCGAGISSDAMKAQGFYELCGVDFSPKDISEDRFAQVYARNHPESYVFNIPLELLDPNDLPIADVWVCTLDCTDYSNLASSKNGKDFQTVHLPMILMKLFWKLEPSKRPKAILVENVPNFERIAGNSLRLCLEQEGYHVTMGVINSLDFQSRTERVRFFMVASVFEGFSFPDILGRLETPICADGVITVDTLDWVTAEEHGTLKYFLGREASIKSKEAGHNHKMITYDVTVDTHLGTIPKSHGKIVPENWIRHPSDKTRFAYILDEEQLKYLHGIRSDFYLGDSRTHAIQCIGQGVCVKTFRAIAKQLYSFLNEKMSDRLYKPVTVKAGRFSYEQMQLAI